MARPKKSDPPKGLTPQQLAGLLAKSEARRRKALEEWKAQAQQWRSDPRSFRRAVVEMFMVQLQHLHDVATTDRSQVGVLAHRSFCEASAVAVESAERLHRDDQVEAAGRRAH